MVCVVFIAGSVLCDVASPVDTATRFRARIIIFNINFPITKGFPVSAVTLSVLSHFFVVNSLPLLFRGHHTGQPVLYRTLS